MPLTPGQESALELAAAGAVLASSKVACAAIARHGLSILTTAQWAIESGWGSHEPGNNPFGVKAVKGQPYVTEMTAEYIEGKEEHIPQNFASYPSLAAAFDAHAALIVTGTGFAPAWDRFEQSPIDLETFFVAVAARYATAPDYATALWRIANMPEVLGAIAKSEAILA